MGWTGGLETDDRVRRGGANARVTHIPIWVGIETVSDREAVLSG